jgi:hypothetical protein
LRTSANRRSQTLNNLGRRIRTNNVGSVALKR